MLGEPERDGDQDIYRMLLDRADRRGDVHERRTVKNFAKILGEEQAADLLRTTVVASIGPVTAEAAQQLGIATTVMPERYTIPDLVDALVEHFAGIPTGAECHELPDRRSKPRRVQLDLTHRPRRLRRSAGAPRRWCARRGSQPENFLYPLFVCERRGAAPRSRRRCRASSSCRWTRSCKEAAAAKADGVPGVLLFGLPESKDAIGSARPIRRARCRRRCAR